MSFYFNIRSEQQISYETLISNLKSPHKVILSDDSDELIGDSNKLYVLHKSTRGVTLKYEDQEYAIGLNILASETDFELALDITETLATLTGTHVIPEDTDEETDLQDLRRLYNTAWIDSMKLSGISFFFEKIGQEESTVSIGVCYMSYMIGPEIHALLDQTSELHYYHSLVEHICKTQFFDREQYAIPGRISATDPKTGEKQRIIVFYPNGSQFLPDCDILAFKLDAERLDFPYDRIHEIATAKFRRIDETQYLVDELTDEEYLRLFEHAKLLLSTPAAEPTQQQPATADQPKGKWWKFWGNESK